MAKTTKKTPEKKPKARKAPKASLEEGTNETVKPASRKRSARPKAKKSAAGTPEKEVTTASNDKSAKSPVARVGEKPKKRTRTGTKGKPAASKAVKTATKAGNSSFTPYSPKKNEEYMNNGQKQHFRDILQSWKRELMEEVDRTVNHMKEEASNYPDPADRASQEEEFSLELKTRDRERRLIRKIEETLELIDLDEYGFCESCGVEIGIRRLEARPTATLCIDCKTLDEIKEKRIRG